jgi:hypothetical protein
MLMQEEIRPLDVLRYAAHERDASGHKVFASVTAIPPTYHNHGGTYRHTELFRWMQPCLGASPSAAGPTINSVCPCCGPWVDCCWDLARWAGELPRTNTVLRNGVCLRNQSGVLFVNTAGHRRCIGAVGGRMSIKTQPAYAHAAEPKRVVCLCCCC